MKRLLMFSLLFLTQTTDAGKNCLGHVGHKLRQVPWEFVYCDCNCDQQQKVTYDQGHGYGCVRCGHRLLPKDIKTNENTATTKNTNSKQKSTSTKNKKIKSKKTT